MGTFKGNEIDICIKYRIILAVICTFNYIISTTIENSYTTLKLWILLGTILSCAIVIYLYKIILKKPKYTGWIKSISLIEMIAYGIFVFLGGGFSSSYFLYYMGCLLVMIAFKCRTLHVVTITAWYLICTTLGSFMDNKITCINIYLNLSVGTVIIIATFYIVMFYLEKSLKHQEKQEELNISLQIERDRAEQALKHVTDLYEAVNLFAMTDKHEIIKELANILWHTIAPCGCILIKMLDGEVEKKIVCGLDEKSSEDLVCKALKLDEIHSKHKNWEIIHDSENAEFECIKIGKMLQTEGIFIRKVYESEHFSESQDDIYFEMIDIIFKNLDIYSQLEGCVVAEEKHRLASEIHDTVLQGLFALACRLKIFEMNVDRLDIETLKANAREFKESAELVMKELRESIYGRSFEESGENTFQNKIKSYMEEIKKLSGVDIQLSINEDSEIMTTAQKVAIYRIACEAVNNAVKHGKAQHITVNVGIGKGEAWVEITDNGIGFKNSLQIKPFYGNGLKNMRRMVSALRGQFLLEPAEGHGTKVEIRFPI